ncbi:OmpA family protein [Flavobacterium sp.]|uniref:OmpA family protein n=1 Tax=Flavobacterium sp. TaxID=239 RepID=UPI003529C3A4
MTEYPNAVVLKMESFCDWVGNNPYNNTLSDRRIQTIKNILLNKIQFDKNAELNSYGKRFLQNKKQSENRRVDVYYTYPIDDYTAVVAPKKTLNENVLDAEIGEILRLEKLYFYNNSGDFKPESKPVLEQLLQTMKQHPTVKIEIQGHICCMKEVDKLDIAKVRALAVYNYLVENGINKNRLQYKSFGSSKPIYAIPEKNDTERDANRRVEILILEK